MPGDALRPFMDAEIAADPVAGAVIVVETLRPQGRAGQGVDGVPGRAVRKAHLGQRHMTLQHEGVTVDHLLAGIADGDGAGDVGGAVEILATRIDQQQLAPLDAAVGLGRRAIVDHRPVGARARDGVEGEVLQRAGGGAEALQLRDRLDLVRRVHLPLRRQPVQEPAHGCAVPPVRRMGAADLHGVLGRAGQGAGVLSAHDMPARRRHLVEIPGRSLRWVEQHPLSLQGVEGGGEFVRAPELRRITEPGGQLRGDLVRVEEQGRQSLRVHNRLTEGEGRADHIAAADVEQPGEGRRSGQHRDVCARAPDRVGDALALGSRGFAGLVVRVRPDGRLGLWRAVGPGDVDGVGIDRDQHCARAARRLHQTGEGVRRVQPRVIADLLPGLQGLGEPLRHAAFHHVVIAEQPTVDLSADLKGVAAVREHRRAILEHNRRPRRTGEAGGEGQPVVRRGQVLVVVLVLMRNDEPVEPLGGHGGANGREVLFAEAGVGVIFEGLEHAAVVARRTASAKRPIRPAGRACASPAPTRRRGGCARPGESRGTDRRRGPAAPACATGRKGWPRRRASAPCGSAGRG